MTEKERRSLSKFLSLVLRHQPELIGVTLDAHGFVDVNVLLARCADHGRPIARAALDEVVAKSDKQRFAFSADGAQIRANQGHSVEVDLGYAPATPPGTLFHGTVARSLEAIRAGGLQPMQRHHVHLSSDRETALTVGGRRGAPVILEVDAGAMHGAGKAFYRTDNGVWLTDVVDPRYILFPAGISGP